MVLVGPSGPSRSWIAVLVDVVRRTHVLSAGRVGREVEIASGLGDEGRRRKLDRMHLRLRDSRRFGNTQLGLVHGRDVVVVGVVVGAWGDLNADIAVPVEIVPGLAVGRPTNGIRGPEDAVPTDVGDRVVVEEE